MTYREMNLKVFRREPIPGVFFQPRFEPWVDWQRQNNALPGEIAGMELGAIYDHVDCGMRYVDYYTGMPRPIGTAYSDEVQVTVTEGPGVRTETYHTPYGDLTETLHYTVDRTWRTVGFPANSVEDLDALRWLVSRREIRFLPEEFADGDEFMGDRGVPSFYIPKSPYLALAQQYMRFETFIFALADAPKKVEEVMKAIDDSYDRLYEELLASGVQIINFGENIAEAHMSPRYFEEYLLPWYEKRSGQLRAGGIFTHVHIDGYFRSLLGYLKDMPFDGLEALTPKPQGDVTLEEIAAHIGDKILLDGIPAVLFLDHHPREDLQACVEKLVELFHPRLVLGISDELPQAATEEGFKRLKWVADYARACAGP